MIVSREISGTHGLLAPLLMGGGSGDGIGKGKPCRNVLQGMQLEPDDALAGQGRQLEFSLLGSYQLFRKAGRTIRRTMAPFP
jgi:hypothetical protein